MDFKRLAPFAAAAVLALGLWLAWLWQPERQLRLHNATFLAAIEHRHWSKVEALLAADYADRWGHDKAAVLDELRQAFSGFVFLTIEHQLVASDLAKGSVVERIKMSGQGNIVAQFIITKVNGLPEPFTFTWRKLPGGPWAWELVSVDHPSLDPGEVPQF